MSKLSNYKFFYSNNIIKEDIIDHYGYLPEKMVVMGFVFEYDLYLFKLLELDTIAYLSKQHMSCAFDDTKDLRDFLIRESLIDENFMPSLLDGLNNLKNLKEPFYIFAELNKGEII